MANSPNLLILVFLLLSTFASTSAQVMTSDAAEPATVMASDHVAFSKLKNNDIDQIGALWAMAQDRQGFIWFGGENGLARFDGYDLKIYRNIDGQPHSLSSSYVYDLLVDSRGRLWVGTIHGLNLYRPASDDFERFFQQPGDGNSLGGNGIRCLLEDSNKKIWIGHGQGGLTRLDPEIFYFEQFQHQSNNPDSLSENSVYALAEDQDGALWIGTSSRGLDKLMLDAAQSQYSAKFEHYRHSPGQTESLSGDEVRALWVDKLNQLWVGTTQGLNRFERKLGQFTRFQHHRDQPDSLSFDFVQDIAEDGDGNIWVATSGAGLNMFRRNSSTFSRFVSTPGDASSLFNNNVRALFLDKHNNFWLGHYAAGVSMVDRYASAFKNYVHNPYQPDSLNYSEIVALAEHESGDIWVGTPKGLNLLHRNSGKVTRFTHREDDPSSINRGGVLGMIYDSKKRLWAGLWGGGLNRLDDPASDRFKRYLAQPGANQGLFTNTVWGLAEDSAGRIWAGNHMGGLTYYQESEDRFIRIPSKSQDPTGLDCDSVFSIYEDSRRALWVGCSNGLYVREWGYHHFKHFFHIEGQSETIGANHIWAIQEDSKGRIWFGTQGGGLSVYRAKSDTFKTYRAADGLADNLVVGILEDDMGYLWLATGNGLSRFDSHTEVFRNYDKRHGLPGNVFNRAAYLKTSRNELVFGGKDGLSIFNPRMLKVNVTQPQVVLTDFKLFNKSVEPGQTDSPLTQSITQLRQLELQYDQSSFSIQFSALNFRVPSMNRYAYKLEGFDQNWVDVGGRRWAYYTNLDPGRYVFNVKASNNEGVWNEKGHQLSITILPPWWRTGWAYFSYCVIGIALLTLIGFTLWQKKIAENERRVSDRLRELDKIKNTFLANTSHELRTPLHGIIGLAESLHNGVTGPLSNETQHYLNMIIISGKRLANLVNDILDFSKIRESKISLRKSSIDLHSLVTVVVALFEPMLRERKIEIRNRVAKDFAPVLADENRLQQILYNLIGNAVKFTDEGFIEISAIEQGEFTYISVSDTGIGVAEDKQNAIFNSFEQIENTVDRGIAGTGLGLTVTRQLVELHGGELSIASTLGQGSTFTFSLPKAPPGVRYLTTSPKEKSTSAALGYARDYMFSKSSSASAKHDGGENANKNFHILIVDDEPVNRLVLESFLKIKHYRITECASGEQALDILKGDNDISLVLLDVMMPKLSGLETCRYIREHYNAKELPVIFLTGKNQRKDLEEGFNAGGNDFLNKPISKDELLLRVETHLKLSYGMARPD